MPSIEDLLQKNNLPAGEAGSKDEEAPKQALESTLGNIKIQQKEQEAKAQASALGVPYIDLVSFPITQEAIALIPKAKAKKLKTICFFLSTKDLRLASVNPDDAEVKKLAEEIKEDKNITPKLYKISEHSFTKAFKIYDTLPKIKKAKPGLEIKEKDLKNYESQIKDLKDVQALIKKISVTDFVALVIAGAINFRATDIHIEAEEDDVKIRYRIDGVLNEVASIKKDFWAQTISRIKLLAGLKLNIISKPQDGRFTIYLKKEKIDVRVSALPTAFGESVVSRLLMSSAASLKFEDLGIRKQDLEKLKTEISKLNGMILTTGPTGSGKTTTLYAIINQLNTPDKKIITLEDPIEYKIPGINQSQVDAEKGYTFAKGLRSALRQDPNIMMVGEIRDLETAEVAINAALTGHLVISTLHTNSSIATIPRLLSLGVNPTLLGPALNTAIAQRLVRRICPDCKTEEKLDAKTLKKIEQHLSTLPESVAKGINLANTKFYSGKGCDKCNGFGYKGRIGVYEIFILDKQTKDLITKAKVTEKELADIAQKQGMLTMTQDGLLKALEGITSISEVEREVGL